MATVSRALTYPITLVEYTLRKVGGARPTTTNTVEHPLRGAREGAEQSVEVNAANPKNARNRNAPAPSHATALEANVEVADSEGQWNAQRRQSEEGGRRQQRNRHEPGCRVRRFLAAADHVGVLQRSAGSGAARNDRAHAVTHEL